MTCSLFSPLVLAEHIQAKRHFSPHHPAALASRPCSLAGWACRRPAPRRPTASNAAISGMLLTAIHCPVSTAGLFLRRG